MSKIDFPNNPSVGEIFEHLGQKWKWDGTSWNSVSTSGLSAIDVSQFQIKDDLKGVVTGNLIPVNDETINLGSSLNKFKDLYLDQLYLDLSILKSDSSGDIFVDLNGSGNLVKLSVTDISELTDSTGLLNGGGGGGGISLTDLSVGAEGSPAGDGSLSYDNTSGVFTYTPPDLSGYLTSEIDTLDDVIGRGSLTTQTAVIPFYYDSSGEFPSATTYHGAIAHSHTDGAMYFAHGGDWNKLANYNEISTDSQTLSLDSANVLSISDGNSVDLSGFLDDTNQTLSLDSANVLSISNGNSVDLSGFLDDTNVLTSLSLDSSGGYVLTYTDELGSSNTIDLSHFSSNASVTISDFTPSSPSNGDLWWNSDKGSLKIYYTDSDSAQWVDASPSGGSTSSVSSSITDGTSSVSFDSANDVVIDTDLNVNAINISGHILPSANAQFDLGNAEYKIRHLFLSDNSLWIGENHKMDTSDGNFKTRKRKNNTVPSSVVTAGGDEFGALSYTGEANLEDISLVQWINYLNSLDPTKTDIEDLYPSEQDNNYNSDDYAEIINQHQEGKVPAPIQSGGSEIICELFTSNRFIISDPTDNITVNALGAEPIDGNTVEFTVYVQQGISAYSIDSLNIDGVPCNQLRISGVTPSISEVNTFSIKAIFLGGYWKATVVVG